MMQHIFREADARETSSKNRQTHNSVGIQHTQFECKMQIFRIFNQRSNSIRSICMTISHIRAVFHCYETSRLANIHSVVLNIRSHHYSAAGNRHHNHRHFNWTFERNGIRGRAFNQFWPETYLEQDAIAICNGNESKEHFANSFALTISCIAMRTIKRSAEFVQNKYVHFFFIVTIDTILSFSLFFSFSFSLFKC